MNGSHYGQLCVLVCVGSHCHCTFSRRKSAVSRSNMAAKVWLILSHSRGTRLAPSYHEASLEFLSGSVGTKPRHNCSRQTIGPELRPE
ncbi:hypothetical protein J6590_036075 [Homalodisca vitripennis]|nr:hypothetical protein J6590_036075 [Homalodisca vitripennis]